MKSAVTKINDFPKRIVHLIPTLSIGGAERQLGMLAIEQVKRGSIVHVYVRKGGAYESVLRSRGIEVGILGNYRGLNPILLLKIVSALKKVRPDVVQTWLPQMDVLGGLAARWLGLPWILSERASELAFSPLNLTARVRSWLGRRADAVVANSLRGATPWQKLRSPVKPVKVISNAVDIAGIQNARSMDLGITAVGKKIILAVGRLDRQKAMDIVIRAAALLRQRKDFRILIIGEGPLRTELAALIESMDVGGCVLLQSFQEGWWGFLNEAHCLVSMSRYEGHPNVVLEAAAARCPLVVSDIPEHREFLSSESAMFVPAEDSAKLAVALAEVLDDQESARSRAVFAARRVEVLTVERAADAYESIYQSLSNKVTG